MRLLNTTYHPDANLNTDRKFHRQAARAIILDGDNILLLYTERYHDYTLPGGGVDNNEHIEAALIRELKEETGAQNVRSIREFGRYEEFRPWYKSDYDLIHMESFCFTCEIDEQLGATSFETHEIENGMRVCWMNIHQAIKHNEQTIANSAKKGMSIERETFLLKLIVEELLSANSLAQSKD